MVFAVFQHHYYHSLPDSTNGSSGCKRHSPPEKWLHTEVPSSVNMLETPGDVLMTNTLQRL